jgi:hypothetical protein
MKNSAPDAETLCIISTLDDFQDSQTHNLLPKLTQQPTHYVSLTVLHVHMDSALTKSPDT